MLPLITTPVGLIWSTPPQGENGPVTSACHSGPGDEGKGEQQAGEQPGAPLGAEEAEAPRKPGQDQRDGKDVPVVGDPAGHPFGQGVPGPRRA